MSGNAKPHRRTIEQLRASNPARHVWVSASAGTGKTQVLTDRMLRLMLAGSTPDRILALTFTRAAAAEMQNRLTRRLGEWVGMADADLAAQLEALDVPATPETLARARALFTLSLEVPGGLKVQTLHGFAQGLLAGFPVEAGISPGFSALDDRAAAQLQARALSEVIAQAALGKDNAYLEDLAELAVALGEGRVRQALRSMLSHREGIAAFSTPDAIEPAIRRYLRLPDAGTAGEWLASCLEPGTHDDGRLMAFAEKMAAWDTATGNRLAGQARHWLAGDAAARARDFQLLRGLVLTARDEPQKHSNPVRKFPELRAIIDDIAHDCLFMEQMVRGYELAPHAARLLRVGLRYVNHYAALKRARAVIDYDDMVLLAARLLGAPGMPGWVGWKLDQRFDHILIDEAQDTNARQWSIIRKLAEEYFDGTGSHGGRSLFVVGDYKQAIYGFQGTDPQLFEAERERVAAHARRVETPVDAVPLNLSFRSGPAVLEVVDQLLSDVGHEALGMQEPPGQHLPYRENAAGEVTVWPLLIVGKDPDDAVADSPLDDEDIAEANKEEAQRLMARTLARQVAAWLRAGDPGRLWLPARGRWAQPGDILILVRNRTKLMGGLVACLHDEGVPVAGVDRLLLTEPYAVLDLIALMRFAVQPEDDLTLAELLVSPFIGWAHEQIRAIAAPRRNSLWQALREAAASDPGAEEARHFLARILAMADFSTPYAFLDTILSGPLQGRRKLVARLGEDANQPIDELLSQALAFEAQNHPSLESFLAWVMADGGDIKRDGDAVSAEVRLMTVHGAKGLEAPVVVLADAEYEPRVGGDRYIPVRLAGADAEIPLFFPNPKYLSGEAKNLYEERCTAERQEDLRLLYVALTRAADHLFVGGATTWKAYQKIEAAMDADGPAPASWWLRARRAVARLVDARACAAPLWSADMPAWRLARGDWTVAAAVDLHVRDSAHSHAAGLVLDAAPPPPRPMRPLTPSHMDSGPGEGPVSGERRRRAERGRLIHNLFQHLPEIEPAARGETARKWLAARGAGAMADEIIAIILPILNDPALAGLFGPEALAEAPIAGLVGDQVITGTIDRLLISADRIRLIDYKTGGFVPMGADDVHVGYLRQMAAYRAVLLHAFSGRRIDVALLYTAGPKLIYLPGKLLDAHAPG